MPNKKIHRIFTALFLFMLFLPICSEAQDSLLSALGLGSGGGNVEGYLNVSTPDGLYRIYGGAVRVSFVPGSSGNPCPSQNFMQVKSVDFSSSVKVDLSTYTYPITSAELSAMRAASPFPIVCLQLVTYHGAHHTGEVDSTPVQLPDASQSGGTAEPFNMSLNLS